MSLIQNKVSSPSQLIHVKFMELLSVVDWWSQKEPNLPKFSFKSSEISSSNFISNASSKPHFRQKSLQYDKGFFELPTYKRTQVSWNLLEIFCNREIYCGDNKQPGSLLWTQTNKPKPKRHHSKTRKDTTQQQRQRQREESNLLVRNLHKQQAC